MSVVEDFYRKNLIFDETLGSRFSELLLSVPSLHFLPGTLCFQHANLLERESYLSLFLHSLAHCKSYRKTKYRALDKNVC